MTWDDLHRQERFRLRYPSEHVVRFLAGMNLAKPSTDRYWGSALDIGCGAGRHLELLREAGWFAYGTDSSFEAVCRAREVGAAGGVEQAEMTKLPHIGDHFDVALAYGVFYYGTWDEMQAAVDEMHRVLRPHGHGFVCVRTTDDWRARRGAKVGTLTYQLELPRDPEDGMVMNFLPQSRIEAVYARFAEIEWEKCEWTTHGCTRKNSDWLITVTK